MDDLLDSQWGQQLLSDYHVVKCIHISHMSEVFALESADGRTRLILKAMKLGIIGHQMLETLKATNIDGVVPILDYKITERHIFVIKPYVVGVSLQEFIIQGLSIQTLLHLMIQLVKIVSNCHSQPTPIIMRDIKPDNLMVCQGQLKFFDMESCKLKVSTTARRDTVLLGTPGYAAPEQYGFQNSDERTDIYAIGQVMNSLLEYVVVTKSNGFIGTILQKLLIRSARRVAKRATLFDPEQRFQSSRQLEKTLEEISPRIYVSSMVGIVMMLAILFVGFQFPGLIETNETIKVTEGPTEVQGTRLVEAISDLNPITEPTTTPESMPASESVSETLTESSAQTSAQTSTKTSAQTSTQTSTDTSPPLIMQPTIKSTKQITTKAGTTQAAGLVTADSQGMVEVRFSGNIAYSSEEAIKCNFLVSMEGVTDPTFQKQFGNLVTLNKGLAQYSDINRSKMVSGDRYHITGYLDLNGNHSRDYHEPSEFIREWTFNGHQSQTIDFVKLVKDHQFTEEPLNPGESDFTKTMKANFKVAQYGCSKDDFEILLSTFGVNGNGTGIMRITQDHLKDIKLVVMANTRNEPISDYVQSALNAIGFTGGSGMSLGWYDNRFWIYFNASSSEEFKTLIDKDRIVMAIGKK